LDVAAVVTVVVGAVDRAAVVARTRRRSGAYIAADSWILRILITHS
jgi:hypothetical protein